MAKQMRKTKKAPARRPGSTARGVSNRTVVGVLGVLLGLWLIYGTLTIQPFRWGTFAEELIVALCVVFALRLLCMAKLSGGLIVACLILLPAGIIVYGAYASAADGTNFYRFLCLAGAGVLSLMMARLLDSRPDGVLVAFLLFLAAMPGLIAEDTLFIDELMRLFLTAGMFFAMVSIREKSPRLPRQTRQARRRGCFFWRRRDSAGYGRCPRRSPSGWRWVRLRLPDSTCRKIRCCCCKIPAGRANWRRF